MTLADLKASAPGEVAAGAAANEVLEIKTRSGFAGAVRRSAAESVDLYSSGRLVGWILGDRARALFGFVVTYLHASRDPEDPRSGITPSRVKAFCAARELCSPGRAGAMLGLMHASGYLTLASGAEDRRVRRLVPTPKLLTLQRERLHQQFAAAAEIIPEAEAVLTKLHQPEFQSALALGLAEYFIGGFRILHHAPELMLFAERSAGVVILYSLMLSGTAGGPFPPADPVDLAIAPIARRFGVSRVHILRLLRDAESQGLVERVGPDGASIRFTPSLVEAVHNYFAALFQLLREGARGALARAGDHQTRQERLAAGGS